MVNGCRGNRECRTILLAAFLRALHTVRSRFRLLRELGLRFHQLRTSPRRIPGLKSRGDAGLPSASEMEDEGRCDKYKEGDGAREGVGVVDDSEDERPPSSSARTRFPTKFKVSLAAPSESELDKNSYASFDG